MTHTTTVHNTRGDGGAAAWSQKSPSLPNTKSLSVCSLNTMQSMLHVLPANADTRIHSDVCTRNRELIIVCVHVCMGVRTLAHVVVPSARRRSHSHVGVNKHHMQLTLHCVQRTDR